MSGKKVTHVVCIKERKVKNGADVYWNYTPVYQSNKRWMAMAFARGCKKYHNHVVIESRGDGYYGETSI